MQYATTARPASTHEQRAALRLPAAQVPSIQSVRLSSSDSDSSLVNISTSGVLVECASKPRPGSLVTVTFVGSFQPSSIRGRVARTIVASLGKDGIMRYMVGIAFENPIELEEPAPATVVVPAPELAEPTPKIASSRLQNRW